MYTCAETEWSPAEEREWTPPGPPSTPPVASEDGAGLATESSAQVFLDLDGGAEFFFPAGRPIRIRDRRGEYSRAKYQREYYVNGWRDRRLAKARALKLQFVQEKGGRCMDCGFVGPQECYHFDHRPGTGKLRAPGSMFATAKLASIRAELEKCDLVCANCHATRTVSRGAGGKRKVF